MVKTPRTRHSKTKREPVTIDLEADAIRREDDGADSPQPSPAEPVAPAEQDAALQDANTASEPVEAEVKPDEPVADFTEQRAGATEQNDPMEQQDQPAVDEREAETSADGGSGETPPPFEAPPQRSGGGFGRAVAAGILGGVVALGAAGGLQWAGVLPPLQRTEADPAIGDLRQELDAMRNELAELRQAAPSAPSVPSAEALEQALAGPRQEIAELRDSVTALQSAAPSETPAADLQPLEQRLAELEQRVGALAADTEGTETAELSERLANAEGRIDGAVQAAEAAQQSANRNTGRLDEIAAELTQLSEQVASQDEGPRLALIVAASALRSAVERGQPFSAELETYTALAPDAEGLDALRQHAARGIPTQAQLAEEAPQVASQIAASTTTSLPPDAGLFDRLMASARSAVTVRPVGEVEGDTPGAIAARMEAAVQRGDYAQALAEYDSLPAPAKEVASDFADRLRARQAAEAALNKALSGALEPA